MWGSDLFARGPGREFIFPACRNQTLNNGMRHAKNATMQHATHLYKCVSHLSHYFCFICRICCIFLSYSCRILKPKRVFTSERFFHGYRTLFSSKRYANGTQGYAAIKPGKPDRAKRTTGRKPDANRTANRTTNFGFFAQMLTFVNQKYAQNATPFGA